MKRLPGQLSKQRYKFMLKSAILAVFCARSIDNSASRKETTNLTDFIYELRDIIITNEEFIQAL